MQEKLLSGNLQDQNEKHEAEIRLLINMLVFIMYRRREMELEQKVIEAKRLKRELFERDEEKLKQVERAASLQEEAEQLTKKLQKVQ